MAKKNSVASQEHDMCPQYIQRLNSDFLNYVATVLAQMMLLLREVTRDTVPLECINS